MSRCLEQWVARTVRRSCLDRDLERVRSLMTGRVLEIGNGRQMRRGRFMPPVECAGRWDFLDLTLRLRPHVLGDVQRLPIKGEAYDCVVCLEVLEYVPNLHRAVAEIARVLVPGGRLILSVPFVHRVDSTNDLWRFTGHGVRILVSGAGLVPCDLQPQGGAHAVTAAVLKYCASCRSAGWSRLFLLAAVYPLAYWFEHQDGTAARRRPELVDYATGYLLVADKPGIPDSRKEEKAS